MRGRCGRERKERVPPLLDLPNPPDRLDLKVSLVPVDRDVEPKLARFRLERARKFLRDTLRWVPCEEFIQMIWAVDLLQGGSPQVGRKHLVNVPEAAIGAKLGDKHFAYKWLLEDLINELLTIEPVARPRTPHRVLDCRNFDGFIRVYNALHEMQDSEQILDVNRRENILAEMARIGHRQFPWQQGPLNIPTFYRAAVMYGDGALSDAYIQRHGISPSNMMMFGLGVWAQLGTQPTYDPRRMALPEIGLTQEIVDAGSRLVTAPMAEHRRKAKEFRGGRREPHYRPSSLRAQPCISFGDDNSRIRAPLRELVISRCTDGLYYDLVGISDDVRRELGRAFEDYATRFIAAVMDAEVSRSAEYRHRGNTVHSPDALIGPRNNLAMIIECKAAKMSFEARFAENRRAAGQRGFDELSKGVRQIWKFVSHMRRGIVPGYGAAADIFGLVLTADPWMRMTVGEHQQIFEQARAEQDDPDVAPEDQCPVGFTHIEDFERMALGTDTPGLFRTCRLGSDPNYIGWGFAELRDRAGAEAIQRPYPFREDLPRVLPWWKVVDEAERRRRS